MSLINDSIKEFFLNYIFVARWILCTNGRAGRRTRIVGLTRKLFILVFGPTFCSVRVFTGYINVTRQSEIRVYKRLALGRQEETVGTYPSRR